MDGEQDPGGEPATLSPAAEHEWARLRAHLELVPGFWLGVVFSSDPAAVRMLDRRTATFLRRRARAVVSISPEAPDELGRAIEEILGPAARASACVWVSAVRADQPGQPSWAEAWERLLLRLNERRDAVRRALPGGLVLAAAPEVKPLARQAAPDLWSVRSIVVEVAATAGGQLSVARARPRRPTRSRGRRSRSRRTWRRRWCDRSAR